MTDLLKKPKAAHYKIISISLYTRDIAALDTKLDELKRRGWTKANRSELIRIALDALDVDGAIAQLEARKSVHVAPAPKVDDAGA